MTDRTCRTPECGNPVLAREMCRRHYMKWRDENPDLVRRNIKRVGPCTVDGCENPRSARGLCLRHYNQLAYSAKPRAIPESGKCVQCGKTFSRAEKFATNRKYCSDACKGAAKNEASKRFYADNRAEISQSKREERAAGRAEVVKTCPQCGHEFSPKRDIRQKFCSSRCGANYHRDSSSHTCGVVNCDRPVRARDMCSMHYRRWSRQVGREKPEAWSQERYERWKKRQDQKHATQVQPIRNVDVFERDGWRCGICDDLIDRSLVWPDPMCATLDHIIPLSEDGTHTLDNVRAAHARCNIQKGASLAA